MCVCVRDGRANRPPPRLVEVTVGGEGTADVLADFDEGDPVEGRPRRDLRAPDFNGDRAIMEYQGIDPDIRGPFPGIGGSIMSPN